MPDSRTQATRLPLVLTLLLPLGCLDFQLDLHISPGAYKAKKLALVSFYGPSNLATNSVGQAPNYMGSDLADTLLAAVEARIRGELGVEIIPMATVTLNPAYRSLSIVGDADQNTAPRGLRCLPDTSRYDRQLAAFAKQLGVDGVIVIRNYWSLRADPVSGVPYGHDAMHIVIVGKDGERLWDQQEFRDAPHEGISQTVQRPETLVAPTGNAVFDSTREAVLQCLDGFVSAWKEYRV